MPDAPIYPRRHDDDAAAASSTPDAATPAHVAASVKQTSGSVAMVVEHISKEI